MDQETAESPKDTDESDIEEKALASNKTIEPSESEANATVAVNNKDSDTSTESEEASTSAPSSSSVDKTASEKIESPKAGTSQKNETESTTVSDNKPEAENPKVEKTTVGPDPTIRDETIPKNNSTAVSNTTKDDPVANKDADTIKDKPDTSTDADTTKEETVKPDSGKVSLVCDPVCPENTECAKKDNGTECVCKDGWYFIFNLETKNFKS